MVLTALALAGFVLAAFLIVTLTFALTVDASAQNSRAIYDASGKRIGSAATDSQGTTTFYDSGGRVTARTGTDSRGTKRIYDPRGKIITREPRSNVGRTQAQ